MDLTEREIWGLQTPRVPHMDPSYVLARYIGILSMNSIGHYLKLIGYCTSLQPPAVT